MCDLRLWGFSTNNIVSVQSEAMHQRVMTSGVPKGRDCMGLEAGVRSQGRTTMSLFRQVVAGQFTNSDYDLRAALLSKCCRVVAK